MGFTGASVTDGCLSTRSVQYFVTPLVLGTTRWLVFSDLRRFPTQSSGNGVADHLKCQTLFAVMTVTGVRQISDARLSENVWFCLLPESKGPNDDGTSASITMSGTRAGWGDQHTREWLENHGRKTGPKWKVPVACTNTSPLRYARVGMRWQEVGDRHRQHHSQMSIKSSKPGGRSIGAQN